MAESTGCIPAANFVCDKVSDINDLEKFVHDLDVQMATLNGGIVLLTKQYESQSKMMEKIADTIDRMGEALSQVGKLELTVQHTRQSYDAMERKINEMGQGIDTLRNEVQEEMEQLRNELQRYREDHHDLSINVHQLVTANKIMAGVLSIISAALLGAWFQKLV